MKITPYKKDGKTLYSFRASLGYDERGKQRRVHKSGFKTKRDAELAYLKIVAAKPVIDKDNPTLDDMFDRFISIKRLELKDSSIRKLDSMYSLHIKPELGSKKVKTITVAEVQDLVLVLSQKFKSSKKHIGILKNLFSLALKHDYVSSNPFDKVTVPKKKATAHTENYYTKEELQLFLGLAKEQLPHMWYVFFYLLAHTGLRRGEALALEWTDITSEYISVSKSMSQGFTGHEISDTPKTKAGYRKVYIDKGLYDIIKTLDEGKSEYVFSNTKGSFCTSSQPIRQLHKIKGIRYISPHGFRHTHCSLLFSAGVPIPEVQKRLGHTDLKTTLQIYNHVYKEDEKKALEKYLEFMN